ncbi:MAG: cytochrome b/b6 domain-containing protein [Pseudomonadota bacterium]
MTDDASIPSSPTRYSTVAITLHWLIAALLIFEVGLGLRMEAAHGADKFAVFQLHKSIGITILLLVAIRLLWRFFRTPPKITAKPWERVLAHAVHALFYLLLLALPLSGWIIVSTSRIVVPTLLYGVIPWPHFPGVDGAAKAAWHDVAEFIHVNLVTVIYALFALHIAGALKHHFIDRDGDIAKMAPGTRAGAWADPRMIAILAGVLLAIGLGRGWPSTGAARTAAPPVAETPALPTPEPSQPVVVAPPTVPIENASEAVDVTTNSIAAVEQEVPVWTIARGSALAFHTSWSGEAIDGGFNSFDGDIAFDPEQLDRSRVEIRIGTASVFSGDGQRDETLKSDDWFSAGSFANATFKASRFRKTGTDRYVASGTLRIKSVTLPISLPFTLKITGKKAEMQGTATIDRTAYQIGKGDYAATDEIPAAVKVVVKINATRK